MKVEIRVDPSRDAPEILIVTPEATPEIEALAARLRGETSARAKPPTEAEGRQAWGEKADTLTAYDARGAVFLPLQDILRLYAQRQQVLAQTAEGTFAVRLRLYELEARLAPHRFVRISNSEIVNARMITGMDFSLTGTIRMRLRGGVETYASRRYVSKIRKLFDV